MGIFDWFIVGIMLVLTVAAALYTKRYVISVADFLAAGRCAGPYLLAVSEGAAMSGAVAFIALFEMLYKAGFTAFWWQMMTLPLYIFVAVTGWVIYRFRETRCMTLAQFFEIRYSKKFRIFMGLLGFISGVLNFGIFPAVAARFFIYFCDLPQVINLFGFEISTFVSTMLFLILISLFFTFIGGQIGVLVTDFLQGQFTNIAAVIILITLWQLISWGQIKTALCTAPADNSLLHPLHTKSSEDFSYWYFVIVGLSTFYCTMAWQGTQGYNCSARSPHAARMGRIFGTWRNLLMWIMCLTMAIFAFTVMNNPDFLELRNKANAAISTINNKMIQEQMATPIALRVILPKGIMGIMAAMMLASFIANFDTYLHSWGSIFIQDVILPFRSKPLDEKTHLLILKLSILGVALFVCLFSVFFNQTDYVLMFMAITGSIYLAGAGAAIIGGLYWSRGNSLAAWTAAVLGLVLSIAGMACRQLYDDFPLNGQRIMFVSMFCAAASYVFVSLFKPEKPFNLNKMLHRGKYALDNHDADLEHRHSKWGVIAGKLGINKEFSRSELIFYCVTLGLILGLFLLTVVGTIVSLLVDMSEDFWAAFWHQFLFSGLVFVIIVTVWLSIGGIKNLLELFRDLKNKKRNSLDTGMVINHQNLDEQTEK